MSLKEGTGSEICLRRSRSSTAAVMSTVSEIEKSGAVAFDSAMRRDTVCWSRVSSWISASPLAPASPRFASLAGSFFSSLPFFGLSFSVLGVALGLLGGLGLAAAAVVGGRLHVGLHDPAARPGALELSELHAEVARHAPRNGRRLHAPVAVPV